jgi:hypothetical protein
MQCKLSFVAIGRFVSDGRDSGTRWMRGWGRPQSRRRRCEESKPSYHCLESNPGRPANILVTTPGTLSVTILVVTRFMHANATEYKLT